MLESHIETLGHKHGISHGLLYDQMIFERNKIIRRDYTLRERYFNGSRAKMKIEQDATDKAYKILDRYYNIKAHSKTKTKVIMP